MISRYFDNLSALKALLKRKKQKINKGEFIHSCIYIFIFFLARFVQSHLLIIFFFLNFQGLKGETFLLSTHLRCFNPTVMFFFKCTIEQFIQNRESESTKESCFFLENTNSDELSLARLK